MIELADLPTLYEAEVHADEIDNLGHMNVRFYGAKAGHATDVLLERLGMETERLAASKTLPATTDFYTRYYNEQLEGARLALRGGVLDANTNELAFFLEMVNVETEQLAATFVHRVGLFDLPTRERLEIGADLVARARAAIVPWPDYGQPRSLTLDPVSTSIDVAELQRRNLGRRFRGYEVTAELCDAYGFMTLGAGMNPFFLRRANVRGEDGVPVFDLPDGRRLGWAMLENRHSMIATPRVGDTVQSFFAHTKIERKTHQGRNWALDPNTGTLFTVGQIVNLGFDIDARRSMEIPPSVRAELETTLHPDLA